MAWEGPQIKVTGLTAGADLSAAANQYKFVKLDTNGKVVIPTAATDTPVGVLQNKPKLDEAAEVCAIGQTKIQADGALTEGTIIGTSADGQATAKTATGAVGQILQEATAAGQIVSALVNCASMTTA